MEAGSTVCLLGSALNMDSLNHFSCLVFPIKDSVLFPSIYMQVVVILVFYCKQHTCTVFGIDQHLLMGQVSVHARWCSNTACEGNSCLEELTDFSERWQGTNAGRAGGGNNETLLMSTAIEVLALLVT